MSWRLTSIAQKTPVFVYKGRGNDTVMIMILILQMSIIYVNVDHLDHANYFY